jgi:hypothetical protein
VLDVGVRQGSVLAPFLFAVYIDDLVEACVKKGIGEIILYADDILLIARSISCLQKLFNTVEQQLCELDLMLNYTKSCGLRIGRRYDKPCTNICSQNGQCIAWVNELRYLGVWLVASSKFKCSFSAAKRKFCVAANMIYSKVQLHGKEEVVLHLLKTKCLPILLYGVEACPLVKADLSSLDFLVVRFLMKLFKSSCRPLIDECLTQFDFKLPSQLIGERQVRFVAKTARYDNLLCNFYKFD